MNTLRIIGGQWRGRKLKFPTVDGLRPTTDRVRETLFNWLMADIQGARCLDLFAGSGMLGFEALSRGAAQVVMCDTSRNVIQQLKTNRDLLKADRLDLQQNDALRFIEHYAGETFNVIFIDPPFYQDLVAKTLIALQCSRVLSDDTLIYVEQEKQIDLPKLPEHWKILKEQKTGQVKSFLLQVQKP